MIKNKFLIFGLSVILGLPFLAHAQFGNLLQQLQKMAPPAQGGGGGQMAVGSGGAPAKGGLVPSDQWCSQQVGVLGNMALDEKQHKAVIASEFNIADLDALQDQFLASLKKEKINKTFPHARFFQASFETKKVRGIYDSFLAFPEPGTLSALINISKAQDPQERADALMALTFLHLQAPELSISKDRWFANYQNALMTDHFTALVFRARINSYGEYGPKNLSQALGDLVTAGNLKDKYLQEGGTKEWDTQNYKLIHNATGKDIYNNEPNMPFRQQWQSGSQLGLQIEQAQQAFARQLPNTRAGRMFSEAIKLNAESIEIGNKIITRSQAGNQTMGQIESIKSLRENEPGERQVFADMSPELQVSQLKIISKVGSLDDEQKKMLTQAQEKRLIAQGILFQSNAEVLQMVLSNMSGNIVKMAAPLPAVAQLNNALIQSCLISAKWEQAMRAKGAPHPEIKKSESAVADLSSKFKD
jgi:hypothetical protein